MPTLPRLPSSFARADLEAAGFIGWRTWQELCQTEFREVPAAPAVYVVFRPTPVEPIFRASNPGGRFKGKDPSVARETLAGRWVLGCHVVYIGKADQARRRLEQFARFGVGEPVGHWGGRYIWQLEDSAALLVAWHVVSWGESPRDYEKRLLAHLSGLYANSRPFANLTG